MRNLPDRRTAEIARCNAALLAAHAHLCQTIAARLAEHIAPERMVRLYSRRYSLAALDESWVRMHTRARFGGDGQEEIGTASDVHGFDGAWDELRAVVRNRVAPFRDAELKERLAYEFAEADATLIKVHVRNALSYAHALAARMNGVAAVADYLTRIDMQPGIAGAVHSFALMRLAQSRALPRLSSARAGREISGAATARQPGEDAGSQPGTRFREASTLNA